MNFNACIYDNLKNIVVISIHVNLQLKYSYK